MSALRVFCWVVQRKLHDAVGRGHSQTTSRCKRGKCGRIPTEQSIAARIADCQHHAARIRKLRCRTPPTLLGDKDCLLRAVKAALHLDHTCVHTLKALHIRGAGNGAQVACVHSLTRSASVTVSTPSVHAHPLLPKNSQLYRPAAVFVQHDGQAHGLAIAHHQCNTQQPAVTCVHHCTQRGAATRRHRAADRRPGGHAAAPAALACSCAVRAPLPAACRARRGGARSLVRRRCGRWTRLAARLT